MWLFWGFMFFKYAIVHQFSVAGCDFPKHHLAAVDISQGRNPYVGEARDLSFNYPLMTAWMFYFLLLIPKESAEVWWDTLFAIFTALPLLLVILHYRPGVRVANPPPSGCTEAEAKWIGLHWPSLSALMLALFAPLFLDLFCGNIDPFILLLLVLMGAFLMRGRDVAAGVTFALVCLVKMTPVLFAPGFLLAGRKKVFWTWFALMVAYAALLLVTGLWRWEWYLYTKTLPQIGFYYREISSTLTAMIGKLLSPTLYNTKSLFDRVSFIVSLAVAAVHCGVLAAGWRAFRESWKMVVIYTSMTVVLVSPLLEYHHHNWEILAWLLLFVEYAEGRMGKAFFWTSAVGWLCIFYCRYWNELGDFRPIHPYYVAMLLLYGLWIMTGVAVVRRSLLLQKASR
jgi:hypothetical protein